MAEPIDSAHYPEPGIGIGAAATRLGTTVRTLRHYEHEGLLSPTSVSAGGHRRYGRAALDRARRLLSLRALGLSLDQIRGLVGQHSSTAALVSLLRVQDERLHAEIVRLRQMRVRIAQVIARLDNAGRPEPTTDDAFELLEEISMSIVQSRIYTRTGDDGSTSLGGARRVDKTEPILDVMGDIDELVSVLGVARAIDGSPDHDLLLRMQNDLFDVGADLAGAQAAAVAATSTARVGADYVRWVEHQCDGLSANLQPAHSFVVPGAAPYPASLHHARSVCRRAERHAWRCADVSDGVRRYLNRLSDLLFLLARTAEPAEEGLWDPGAHRPR